MHDIVLMHGAWHGAWAFSRIKPLLEQSGFRVHTPTLTGLGDRAHLMGPHVSLDTHVTDILSFVELAGLERFVLAGHSYSGIVATVAACRMPSKIERLVYLDAFVPAPNQSLLDCVAPPDRLLFIELASSQPEPWRLPPLPPEMYGVTEPGLQAYLAARLTAMSLLCFMQRAQFDVAVWSSLKRAYIGAVGHDPMDRFKPFRERAAADPGFVLRTIEAGHDFFLTHPEQARQIITDICSA